MNRKTELKYLSLIVVIFIAACIETDIYLPAFPDMMVWFSASERAIQNLLTWNFVGICISGPFYGPLSDAFGRKKPLMIALGMFLIGSFITLFAQNLNQMLLGRILQGFGSGGCFTLGTAIIFDAFKKERAIEATNKLNTVIPVIMAGAPMTGGYLNHTFGFRSNFLAITIFVLISFIICVFFFDETLPKEKRSRTQVKAILRDFKQALVSLPFWQLTLALSLLFGGYISFLSGTSLLFVVEFGIDKSIFPLIQGTILGGWVLGSLVLNRCIAKWGISKIKTAGTILCILGGSGLVVTTLLTPKDPLFLTSGMVMYAFGANWIMGLYFPEAMEILPNIKGITASLITSVRLLVAAVVIGMTSALYDATIYPLTAVICGTIVITLPALLLYEKSRRVQAEGSVENY